MSDFIKEYAKVIVVSEETKGQELLKAEGWDEITASFKALEPVPEPQFEMLMEADIRPFLKQVVVNWTAPLWRLSPAVSRCWARRFAA
jgi:hypothetical protein